MKNSLSRNRLMVMLLAIWCIVGDMYVYAREMPENDTLSGPTNGWREKPWPVSRYSIRLGGFWALSNTKIGIGTNNHPYSILDFENDLDMNRNTVSWLINANARFGKHHRVDLSYYNINRKASARLNKDIYFGEHDYPVNSEINAFLNTNIFRVSYGFAFVSNPRIEAGVLVGFHVLAFHTGMEFIGNTRQVSFDDDVKFTAPLPDFGAWAIWTFFPRWAVTAELGYFDVTIKDIHGRIFSVNLALQYKLSKQWEVDLGYTAFDVRVTLDRRYLQSELDWRYSGPTACVVFRFGH